MIKVIYNRHTIATGLAAVSGGGLALLFFSTDESSSMRWIPMMCAGLSWAASDLWIRRKNSESEFDLPFFHPEAGGHLWFVPSWVWGSLLFIAALGLTVGPSESSERTLARQSPLAIGTAAMRQDGTIDLWIRADTGSAVGQGLVSYPKSHKEYEEIIKRVDGLRPGQTKLLFPLPDRPDARF